MEWKISDSFGISVGRVSDPVMEVSCGCAAIAGRGLEDLDECLLSLNLFIYSLLNRVEQICMN